MGFLVTLNILTIISLLAGMRMVMKGEIMINACQSKPAILCIITLL